MAVTLKINVNPEVMLEDPKDILEEPPPRPETPREGENEAATTTRNLRDKLARDRVMLENEQRRTRDPRVGHNVYYKEIQKKLVSRLFLSPGTEGKKRFLQKNPQAAISRMSFKKITELESVSFPKVKCVIYEIYKLFTRMQTPEETLEAFHAALNAQAARSEIEALKSEIFRDFFLIKNEKHDVAGYNKIRNVRTRGGTKESHKIRTKQFAFQKTKAAANVGASTSYIFGVKIKQEPVMAVRNSTGSTRNQQYERESNKRPNNNRPNTSSGRVNHVIDAEGHLMWGT